MNQHEVIRVSRRWVAVIAALPLSLGILYAVWAISWPAIEATGTERPLPADWTWLQIVIMDILAVLIVCYFYWAILGDLLVRFTEESVSKPSIIGRRTIRWVDVRRIEIQPPLGRIRIVGPDRAISINPYMFRDPSELHRVIRSRVSALSQRR